ncbi:MAG: 2-oxoacid:ferredoxin oxidoreductase subunit beta [Gammaproteobacteria bacterium]|jgi:2-oxoglutarate ferredoxin oxidoreductase subunit beta|nr:2-oxoacid:ferredoxin oxidoreductase subunit beta [Gammaproteobacteria bacterium]MBT3859493.1 2-oxoacid:ferredoxin oxidoreductase subunit beta [Gammaproteobacteria bacterium]MBT3986613.1 2-oxoacid:ferredoxin oxidoreductase subunit beta [Gammaproteobacteria bacterium]MBT4255077.1 2-oxoacid:ferredoxin oxidoreductase subunit beta [Gammaproteobacteria bacterium]MBT4581394.1 2-oxoacid:ferredoxin oxidoreductase subunit beta [Gammaproteobacteria bacterium]
MSYIRKPKFSHPGLQTNDLGLTRRDYEGTLTTLCGGCGHDSISAAIIQAAAEMSLEPHRVAKISGIGCSSKIPSYFLSKAHGFNSVHGRMPSVATGANIANQDLHYIGISGDGDSASIGLGQFCHIVRRQVNMLYIVANNGTYGLTKGQMSATADMGSRTKSGEEAQFENIDMATLAIELGASFVARSFSGDKKQLVPLLQAGLSHKGFAFIDVVSPCVTFNNTDLSSHGYKNTWENYVALSDVDFVPMRDEITTNYEPGEEKDITLHDGSVIHLHKTDDSYDPTDKDQALGHISKYKKKGKIATGLLYINQSTSDLHETQYTIDRPLNSLGADELCPGNGALNGINDTFR